MALKRLQALSVILFMISKTGESTVNQWFFKKMSQSKCVRVSKEWKFNVNSPVECAQKCTLHDICGFISYKKPTCHLYRNWHDSLTSYNCDWTSYVKLDKNDKQWQKVYIRNITRFLKQPMYLYWDSLPIHMVKLDLVRGKAVQESILFNGERTNFTSWFQQDKVISPWHIDPKMNYIFNFRTGEFHIKGNNSRRMNVRNGTIRYRKVLTDSSTATDVNMIYIYILFKYK